MERRRFFDRHSLILTIFMSIKRNGTVSFVWYSILCSGARARASRSPSSPISFYTTLHPSLILLSVTESLKSGGSEFDSCDKSGTEPFIKNAVSLKMGSDSSRILSKVDRNQIKPLRNAPMEIAARSRRTRERERKQLDRLRPQSQRGTPSVRRRHSLRRIPVPSAPLSPYHSVRETHDP